MRRALIALILILVLGSSDPAPADNKAWADKLFQGNTSHDFGSVPRGAQLSYRFPLTNIYATELHIVTIRASCGCTTVTPATKVLKPRQTSYIDIFMDTRKFTGPKAVTIYLTVGPDYISTATLRVTANSRADVVFNPGQVNFGVVSPGQTPKQTIDVEYAGVLPWKVTEVVKTSAPFNVTVEELYRRPGQVGYRATVALKADAPAGPLHHQLQLRTNDKESPLLPILVEGTVQAPLTVVPGTVAMGDLRVNEVKTQRVVVRGTKPFRITAIDGLGDGLTAPLPSKTATVHFITIQYQPGKTGSLSKQLQVKTDLDQNASAIIKVEANVSE
jgi:hypothetical protein